MTLCFLAHSFDVPSVRWLGLASVGLRAKINDEDILSRRKRSPLHIKAGLVRFVLQITEDEFLSLDVHHGRETRARPKIRECGLKFEGFNGPMINRCPLEPLALLHSTERKKVGSVLWRNRHPL